MINMQEMRRETIRLRTEFKKLESIRAEAKAVPAVRTVEPWLAEDAYRKQRETQFEPMSRQLARRRLWRGLASDFALFGVGWIIAFSLVWHSIDLGQFLLFVWGMLVLLVSIRLGKYRYDLQQAQFHRRPRDRWSKVAHHAKLEATREFESWVNDDDYRYEPYTDD